MKPVLTILPRATAIAGIIWTLTACGMPGPRFEPVSAFTPAPAGGSGLYVQFFGVTTIVVGDGEKTIMTDGFFSRPGVLRLALPLWSNEGRIDAALKRGDVGHVNALLVAHSHYDHALDSPMVANKTGARLYGSEATANVARARGLHESRIQTVTNGEKLTFGDFHVTVRQTPHAYGRPAIRGNIDAPFPALATMWDYKSDTNFSFLIENRGTRILIVTSASLPPGALGDTKADVVFLAVGNLSKQSDDTITAYWVEAVEKTDAKVVIPVHWDDFVTRSLDKPLQGPPPFKDDVARPIAQLQRLAAKNANHVRIEFLAPFQRVTVQSLLAPRAGTPR